LAQYVPMGVPLPTTMLLEKPAPNVTLEGKQLVEIGVKNQTYKFMLKDAYVDDPNGKIFWNDVWRQVELSRPNFQVQGPNGDLIAKIQPGQKVTLKAMYAPFTRTLEVTEVEENAGISEPPKHY
jgi:hypothetical protein